MSLEPTNQKQTVIKEFKLTWEELKNSITELDKIIDKVKNFYAIRIFDGEQQKYILKFNVLIEE